MEILWYKVFTIFLTSKNFVYKNIDISLCALVAQLLWPSKQLLFYSAKSCMKFLFCQKFPWNCLTNISSWIQSPPPTATNPIFIVWQGNLEMREEPSICPYEKLIPSAECHNWVSPFLHLRFTTIHVLIQFIGSPTTELGLCLWNKAVYFSLVQILTQGTTYIVYVGMCTKYSTLFKLQALRPICDGLHETKPCLPLLPLYLPGPETATAHIQLCFLPPRGCTW